MLDQNLMLGELKKNGVTFFTGVLDSYLNGFCNHILKNAPDRTIIAANKGNAIGIASGYYFASGETPLVYMQNSRMGNTVNPFVSLADKHVYTIPMLLLIGWQGRPDAGDWPQHELQGEITPGLLDIMHIPYTVLENGNGKIGDVLAAAVSYTRENRKPYALIASKGVMAGEKTDSRDDRYPMNRGKAIEIILDHLPSETIYAATMGRATRELFFLREKRKGGKDHGFLNVGTMGHTSSVALGIVLEKKDRKAVCLDGDSAVMMYLGAMTMVSKLDVSNFIHVVLNNGAHESVGGQPPAGHLVDLTGVAQACDYRTIGKPVGAREGLIKALDDLKNSGQASFIDVRIHKGLSRKLPPLDFLHKEAVDGLIYELNKDRGKGSLNEQYGKDKRIFKINWVSGR